MTNGAEKYDYVIGVDTHARTRTYAIINTRTGACPGWKASPVSGPGMAEPSPGSDVTPPTRSLLLWKAPNLTERQSATNLRKPALPSLR